MREPSKEGYIMTDKVKIAKDIASFIVGISVCWTVTNVIDNTTDPEKIRHKAEAYIGGAVIGFMVADYAETWTDQTIDKIVNWYKTQVKNKK